MRGVGIVRASQRLGQAVDLSLSKLTRPTKHHVLEEMRHPFLPGRLVERACPVAQGSSDYRSLPTLDETDLKSVRQLLGADCGGDEEAHTSSSP